MENYEVLLKSYWSIADIQEYYKVSESKAISIKTKVEKDYGYIPCETEQERGRVRADDVIKVMGGNSRLEELKIIQTFKEINNG